MEPNNLVSDPSEVARDQLRETYRVFCRKHAAEHDIPERIADLAALTWPLPPEALLEPEGLSGPQIADLVEWMRTITSMHLLMQPLGKLGTRRLQFDQARASGAEITKEFEQAEKAAIIDYEAMEVTLFRMISKCRM